MESNGTNNQRQRHPASVLYHGGSRGVIFHSDVIITGRRSSRATPDLSPGARCSLSRSRPGVPVPHHIMPALHGLMCNPL